MVMTDTDIHAWATGGGVSPYSPELVNPASIDLRFSGRVRYPVNSPELWGDVAEVEELTMQRGDFVLLDTLEYICMPIDWGGNLMLKSSMGRRGVEHLHAGWFDPSFEGTATLEMVHLHPYPITLKAGQPIVQLVLVRTLNRPARGYDVTGRYNGQNGPQPSRGK